MNDLLVQFIRLPRARKIGLVVGIYAAVLGLYIYLGYLPKTEEIETLQTKQKALLADREKTQEIADNLGRFKIEVESLNEDLNKALKELPNDREIDKLLKRVSTIGKKIGLEFLLFQPLPEVVEGFYAQVPVKIEVSGSFHEIAMFFDRIGKLSRIVNINDIQMSGPQERGGKIILKTAGKATTYRFLDAEEVAAANAAKDKGKGKAKPAKDKEE